MNCEQCQIELEDFLYGELKGARAAELQAHLAACADCRPVRENLAREAEVFARYYEQAALAPTPEMWAAIRDRISGEQLASSKAESRTAWWRWLRLGVPGSLLGSAALRQAVFAAILILVSVAATALYFTMHQDGSQQAVRSGGGNLSTPQPGPSVTPSNDNKNEVPLPREDQSKQVELVPAVSKAPPRPSRPLTEDELIRQQLVRTEREYQSTIQLLDRRIARRKDSLDPVLLTQYQSSLALIDNSITASRRALREHPADAIAAQFFLAAYARKVELMEEVAMR